MDNPITLRLDIQRAAQEVMSQIIINNKEIEKEIGKGIKEAVNNYDFNRHVKELTYKMISETIENAFEHGKVKEYIKEKINEHSKKIINKKFEKIFKALEQENG